MSTPHPFLPPTRIACIGEAMIEISALDLPARSASVTVAGDVFNTAVYLKRTLSDQARVSFVTAVGSDPTSDAMVETIKAEELETNLIARHPTRSVGLYAIHVDTAGERAFTYWRTSSAARALFGENGPDLAELSGFGAVYLSAITLAILPPDVRAQLIVTCARLKTEGVAVIFDSNYRPQLWNNLETARDSMDAMWAASTLALPSVEDEQMLHPGLSAPEVAARIAALGPREVVVKRGARGPLIWADGEITETQFSAAEKVVDTTAAGDAFNAAYMAARMTGLPLFEAAQAGHDLARTVVGSKGAILPQTS